MQQSDHLPVLCHCTAQSPFSYAWSRSLDHGHTSHSHWTMATQVTVTGPWPYKSVTGPWPHKSVTKIWPHKSQSLDHGNTTVTVTGLWPHKPQSVDHGHTSQSLDHGHTSQSLNLGHTSHSHWTMATQQSLSLDHGHTSQSLYLGHTNVTVTGLWPHNNHCH